MAQDEIIRMALEAGSLVFQSNFCDNSFDFNSEQLERFAAIVSEHWIETNKALAKEIIELKKQAEQEPVAWRWKNGNEWFNKYTYLDNGAPDCPELCEPLYAAPVSIKTAVLAEREACAKVCEAECIGFANDDEQLNRIASAIRARGD